MRCPPVVAQAYELSVFVVINTELPKKPPEAEGSAELRFSTIHSPTQPQAYAIDSR